MTGVVQADERALGAGAPPRADAPAAGAVSAFPRALAFLLYTVFVLSGVAGLIYESIWSHYLGLFVGHGAYAQVIVLAIFLGGMAVGALIVGERSERVREPLLWYAAAELAVGIYGLAFHDLFLAATTFAYEAVFPAVHGGALLVGAKWLIAGALIVPPSIVLGTTFPLMSAGIIRRAPRAPGRVLALLYFANSLGGSAGGLIAGFYLIGFAGLPGTVLTAAMLNFAVAGAVYLGVRALPAATGRAATKSTGVQPDGAATEPVAVPEATFAARAAAEDLAAAPSSAWLWRLLLAVSFGTAVASFIYEIAWIRMLSLVLGSATHSFELMLSAFILGIAVGALWIHRRADSFREPLRVLGVLQLAMGLAALATLPIYAGSFEWTADLLAALRRSDGGYRLFNLARYGVSLAVMFPAAFFAGTTLPLITKILIGAGHGERSIGAVYGFNTLGSIAGVGLAGLVLLPLTGVEMLLVIGAGLDMALGVAILGRSGSRIVALRRAGLAGALAATAVLVVVLAGRIDRVQLTGGVFRTGVVSAPGSREILFYKDGRTATVAAARFRVDSSIVLVTNGKPDASLGPEWFRDPRPDEPPAPLAGDDATQTMLALLTLAHAPQARTAAVIGQGSGMSSHFLLGSPALERLTTIEIEPEMIEGSRVFYPANHRVFDDPRSEIVIDDAKSFFAAARRRYDLILSEPSNPWVSGVSGLFTDEFYQRIRDYLTDDGVLGQWLHLYEISDGLVLSVLAAVHRNFADYVLYVVDNSDILIVATAGDRVSAPDWRVFHHPAIAADLRRAPPVAAEHLEAMRLLDRATLAPLLDGWGQANSDFFPVLDLGAERARFRNDFALGFIGLLTARFDFAAALSGRRVGFGTQREPPVRVPRVRARALGAALRAPAPMDAAAVDPGLAAARYRLARLRASLNAPEPPTDWLHWLQDVVAVEHDLHGGTAGVADEAFYARVESFAARHAAPAAVNAAVSFLHGLAAWDFPRVLAASEPLLEAADRGTHWLPPDLLLDGTVTAHLATGDRTAARAAYDRLAPRVARSPDNLRRRLMEAYLNGAAAGPADPRLPGPARADRLPMPTRSGSARGRQGAENPSAPGSKS